MRNAFSSELTALAAEDARITLLSGDIGNRQFDAFKANYPTRFFNCGVAEANMVTVAAGMALCGLRPVTYTIASFMTMRCFEQIRIDVCYHNVPVILVGVGAGLAYAANGATHHACEDLACIRALPNMTIICPGDAFEVRAALRAALKHPGPVYLRLGKKGEPVVHTSVPAFTIGQGIILRPGREVALLSTGNLLPVAVQAADQLEAHGLSTQLVSMPTVKPLDVDLLAEVFATCRVVATIEEHSIIGGLGGSVAEWQADQPTPGGRLIRIGTADHFLHEAGEQAYAREHFGLTPERIVERILTCFARTLQSRND